ncbi:MAG: hypothetical protein FWF28_10115 [Micrococcales bacterium]|nr:hypothetical protein [Micrococcales bacterium]
MPWLRRPMGGVWFAALLVSLVGCADQATPPVPGGPGVAAEAGATSGVGVGGTPAPTPLTAATFADAIIASSAHFAIAEVVGGVPMSATGAVRTTAGRPAVEGATAEGATVGGPTAGGATAGEATVGHGTEWAMSLTVPGTGTFDLRMVAGTTYLNAGADTGGEFVVVDPHHPPFGVPAVPAGIDPMQTVADMSGAIASVTTAGAPVVLDGVSAQPYDVAVDISRVTGDTRAAFDALAQSAQSPGATLPAELTVRFWVGADHLVRQLGYTLLGTSVELTFSQWGRPVDVPVPPGAAQP